MIAYRNDVIRTRTTGYVIALAAVAAWMMPAQAARAAECWVDCTRYIHGHYANARKHMNKGKNKLAEARQAAAELQAVNDEGECVSEGQVGSANELLSEANGYFLDAWTDLEKMQAKINDCKGCENESNDFSEWLGLAQSKHDDMLDAVDALGGIDGAYWDVQDIVDSLDVCEED